MTETTAATCRQADERAVYGRTRDVAYDEGVAERIRETFADADDISEKNMFGGIAFMDRGNMCCGVIADVLMARVGPDAYASALAEPHVREMDFTGKPLKGFVYVDAPGFAEDADLARWLDRCRSFTGALPAK